MSVRNSQNESVDQGLTKIPDAPDAPTIGTVTDVGTGRAYNDGAVTVAYTAATTGGPASTFTATSTPGSLTGTGSSSPITVTGLSSQTSYTFTVKGNNVNSVSGPNSSSSSSVTATTVPQAPTIGTFTDGGNGTTGTLSFTAGATGGNNITDYKWSTDNVTYTALGSTTSPLTVGGLTPATYTFYLKAVNANGDSAASTGVSGTVIQPTAFDSIATVTGNGTATSLTFSSIPGTYKHLQIRCFANDGNGNGTNLRFNGVSTAVYAWHRLIGTGSAASASSSTADSSIPYACPFGTSSLNYGVSVIDVFDYASTTKNKVTKTLYGYDENGSGQIGFISGLWPNTAAVTSITLFNGGAIAFSTNTVFALYGIKG